MDWEDDAFRSAQGRIILDLGLLVAAALLLYGLFVSGGGILGLLATGSGLSALAIFWDLGIFAVGVLVLVHALRFREQLNTLSDPVDVTDRSWDGLWEGGFPPGRRRPNHPGQLPKARGGIPGGP